jgi:hypothetical protein
MKSDEPRYSGTEARPLPLLSGHDLIRHGLATPGPQLAIILRQVYEAQVAGMAGTREEALSWVRRCVSPEV